MKTRSILFTIIAMLTVTTLVFQSCKKKDDPPDITPTTGFFTDARDGQQYAYVVIGSQIWMAQNLNYQTANSYWYDDNSANGDIYGRLYTWEEALTVCPSGWHLPSDNEWKTLGMALGMSQGEADSTGFQGTDQGKKMKAISGWNSNGNGTNSSGFNALPGGLRSSGGVFYDLGLLGHWWSSTESLTSTAWLRYLRYDRDQVGRDGWNKENYLSVRCIKD
ncbi:MAG: fibrobacter succinogenes major paralogous domain-containing protein [Bacteroidales bacterium]|nr:fibrobacter succinogenes major paralogous domain-containing protein [Bacteroidales bacterium]